MESPEQKTPSRTYKNNSIPGSVLIDPKIYLSRNESWLIEPVDFTEIDYYLGYQFDPRSVYSICVPKGVIRGGHLESRSKIVTILKGLAIYILIDMRPGDTQGRVESFILGEGEEAVGRSILVPEGVVDAYASISDEVITFSIGDQPYNAFDSLKTLDLLDPALKITWPPSVDSLKHHDLRPDQVSLKLSEFISSLSL